MQNAVTGAALIRDFVGMSTGILEIQAVLKTIDDPEMPISIVDLGMVEDVEVAPAESGVRATVTLLPTFVGCPALPMLEQTVQDRVRELPDVAEVQVLFVFDPPWTVDRISPAGRESLKGFGVTVPENGQSTLPANILRTAVPQVVQLSVGGRTPPSGSDATPTVVPCPFCNAHTTRLQSPFGPTRCRMIYYCESCKNTFEHMKRV